MKLAFLLLIALLLASCAKAPPQAHIDPCTDPCAAIGFEGSHLDISDPNSEYWKKWKKTCDDLRRQKHWSPC